MQTPIIHIQLDESGIPRIINGNVKVKMIAQQHQAGLPVDEIAEHYGITLADVYSALAYYHDHLDFFDQQERNLQPLIESAKQYTDDLKAKIQQRLKEKGKDTTDR